MGKDIYADRNPAITTWVVQDDPDPDKWTVNIQAPIIDAYILIRGLCEGAIRFSELGSVTAANLTYYMAEDLGFQLNRIGGFEAAIRLANEKLDGGNK